MHFMIILDGKNMLVLEILVLKFILTVFIIYKSI